jgi:hypothetical protein
VAKDKKYIGCKKISVRKPEEKRQLENPRVDEGSKMGLKGMECKNMD